MSDPNTTRFVREDLMLKTIRRAWVLGALVGALFMVGVWLVASQIPAIVDQINELHR